MRCEAAIVLARQLAEQPILQASTGSGHLVLLVAVASLAGSTNGAERGFAYIEGMDRKFEYMPAGAYPSQPCSTLGRKVAGRTPFLQRRSTRRPRPRGPPGRGL